MNQIRRIQTISISSYYFNVLFFIISCNLTLFAQDEKAVKSNYLNAKAVESDSIIAITTTFEDTSTYLNPPEFITYVKNLLLKELSLKELEDLESQIFKEISYCKFEYYLNNVTIGKNWNSLPSISDKRLKSIMDSAPNDEVFVKKWKNAVADFTDFENNNSKEIKEHRKNYRVNFDTKIERDAYYEKYRKLSNDLKREKFEEHTRYHNNLLSKLKEMWLNRGRYLLSFYKSKNLLFPVDCINWQEYEGIENDTKYQELTEKMKAVDKRIRRLR